MCRVINLVFEPTSEQFTPTLLPLTSSFPSMICTRGGEMNPGSALRGEGRGERKGEERGEGKGERRGVPSRE